MELHVWFSETLKGNSAALLQETLYSRSICLLPGVGEHLGMKFVTELGTVATGG